MKPGIHPNYIEATVTCSCGDVFTTRSTRREIRTDLCSTCHPFYTGEQRIVDTAGQVERFTKRMEAAAANQGKLSKRQRRLQAYTDRGVMPGDDETATTEEETATTEA